MSCGQDRGNHGRGLVGQNMHRKIMQTDALSKSFVNGACVDYQESMSGPCADCQESMSASCADCLESMSVKNRVRHMRIFP